MKGIILVGTINDTLETICLLRIATLLIIPSWSSARTLYNEKIIFVEEYQKSLVLFFKEIITPVKDLEKNYTRKEWSLN